MILTDRFVAVHQPKTGGTFVASALFRLFGAKWNLRSRLASAFGRDVVARGKHGTFVFTADKHGGCNAVPAAYRDRPILASVRNPYDLYVSQYEFGWWRRREFLPYFRAVPRFERDYPRFPDISFADFVRLANAAFAGDVRRDEGHGAVSGRSGDGGDGDNVGGDNVGGGGANNLGWRTREFVKFYFHDPRQALALLGADGFARSPECRALMHDLHFVRTDRLNRGLHDFLLASGYAREDVGFILEMGKVLPRGKGRAQAQKWERYYTPELRRYVRERERFIFEMFPEFDA